MIKATYGYTKKLYMVTLGNTGLYFSAGHCKALIHTIQYNRLTWATQTYTRLYRVTLGYTKLHVATQGYTRLQGYMGLHAHAGL